MAEHETEDDTRRWLAAMIEHAGAEPNEILDDLTWTDGDSTGRTSGTPLPSVTWRELKTAT